MATFVELRVRASTSGTGTTRYRMIYDPISKLSINLSAENPSVSTFLLKPEYRNQLSRGLEDLTTKYMNELNPGIKASCIEWDYRLLKGKEYDRLRILMGVTLAENNGTDYLERLSDELDRIKLRFRKA